MVYQEERLAACMAEIEPLLKMHFDEVSPDKEAMPLKVNWQQYLLMNLSGRLAFFTAREGTELAGYAAFFLYDHPHHAGIEVAQNDVVFLHPKHRKGGAGYRLLKFCEEQLKQRGVRQMIVGVTPARDFSPLLYRMGYKDEEKLVSKIL